jgi:alkyl hydroperoxide reductase subunit AhpC
LIFYSELWTALASNEAWASALGGLSYPLLSDFHRRVCAKYGLLSKQHNIARRAIVIIDRVGIVRYIEICQKRLPDPDRLIALLGAMRLSASKNGRVNR